jgi:D-alanyl-D-alanine carboxypeptidase
MQPTTLVSTLQETLDRTRSQTVGVVAGFASDYYDDWFGSSGLADIATNTPIQPDDRFQIGSITKTFVATVVLQLVQEGKLSLEDTLAQHLPTSLVGRIANHQQIQIGQLLNHTSGVFNYADVLFDNALNLFNDWTAAELIAFAYDTSYFAPGTSWRYSNTNYILLGEIVEAVTGKPLSQSIRDRVLAPLGMTNTFFATEEEVPGGVVSGYWDIDNDGILNNVSFLNLSWAGASGNMVSTAQDLVKFSAALFSGQLLTPKTLSQMLTLVDTPNSGTFNGYGFGIARLQNVDGVVYGHNGLTLGYRSNFWYSPTEQLTYVDLQNTRVSTNFVRPLLTTWREQAPLVLGMAADEILYGNEVLNGSVRDDVLFAGAGNNTIYGGDGNNILTAGNGNDTIYGGVGNDLILAGNGNNIIYAGDGNNQIFTGSGNDVIFAGNGNHSIESGAGDDIIFAGNGNHQINPGTGFDVVYSGVGSNLFTLNLGEGFVTLYRLESVDRFRLGTGIRAQDLVFRIENSDTIVFAGIDQLAVLKNSQVTALNLV